MTKRWKVLIGEIEHQGDVELTIAQLKKAGATNIELKGADFLVQDSMSDGEMGLFAFDFPSDDVDVMRAALEAAEICL